MPTVNLIDLAALPGGVSSYGSHAVQEATEQLRLAIRHNQALHITPSPYERTMAIATNYRKAAKMLGIGIVIRNRGTRSYRTLSGDPGNEACEIYICITKAKSNNPLNPPQPRVVDTMARSPIVTPHAGYEPSAIIPGLEVSK